MPHLFPKTFPREYKSSGERKVFEYFKKNAPDDWYILHSFRIPEHKVVVFGEADFVVIAPKIGIVILEVKSGGVGFDGTNWEFRNRNGEIAKKTRGPFEQAYEGMFELERIITEKLGDYFGRTHVQYNYGVIFTDEDSFPAEDMTEDNSWRLLQRNEKNDYCEFIRYLSRQNKNSIVKLGKRPLPEIELKDVETIANCLRPTVECVVPLKSYIEASEKDIVSLTEEQISCLDDIEENPRVVVMGGAGTGKTLLAIEDAKQAALQGKRVGIFCFNKYLATFIRLNIPDENVEVYSYHAFMQRLCKDLNGIEKTDAIDKYFNEILPEYTLLALSEKPKKFDKLIIDEFQDLCTETNIKVFNELLVGGLSDGAFTFYGDFARQAIYLNEPKLSILDSYAIYFKKKLTINCRNTLSIGKELIKITGYTDKSYRLKVEGEPVDYITYNDKEDQRKKLLDTISSLRKKGIKSGSILILSPYKREDSIVGFVDNEKNIIGNYGDDPNMYHALFSTIQAYKGLESEVVVLVDVENYYKQNLMYIGISRARSKLYILESKVAYEQRKSK